MNDERLKDMQWVLVEVEPGAMAVWPADSPQGKAAVSGPNRSEIVVPLFTREEREAALAAVPQEDEGLRVAAKAKPDECGQRYTHRTAEATLECCRPAGHPGVHEGFTGTEDHERDCEWRWWSSEDEGLREKLESDAAFRAAEGVLTAALGEPSPEEAHADLYGEIVGAVIEAAASPVASREDEEEG